MAVPYRFALVPWLTCLGTVTLACTATPPRDTAPPCAYGPPPQRPPSPSTTDRGSLRRPAKPRNVILLLSDGAGPEAWTLSRWVKGAPLSVDSILTGAIRTYGADSIITDSAPGATAYATGYKGMDKAISVGPARSTIEAANTFPRLAHVPLVTLLEGAKIEGYATGLIATSNVQHATPAAFSAHVPDRSWYNEIAEQQCYQDIDVVLSGGLQHLLPTGVAGGKRDDGEDLTAELLSRGYQFVRTRTELAEAKPGRLWGLFANNDLAYELDRKRFAPDQPTLAEMTKQAILRLAQSERGKSRGFFLFVEGSKVDFAAHANDPVGVVSELLAFDAAVEQGLNFAKGNDHTQVIVVSDHGTGGITIGAQSAPLYSQTDDDAITGPLRLAKVTAERLAQLLMNLEPNDTLTSVLAREWGVTDLSLNELKSLNHQLRKKQNPSALLSNIISSRAKIGWTTNGHTGADVYLFAYGPDHPQGLVENTSIGEGIAAYLGLSFPALQSRLFVDLVEALAKLGYTTSLDRSDPHNGKLVVTRANKTAVLPFAKNLLIVNGQQMKLEGVVVYAEKLAKVFGPSQVLTLLASEMP